MDKDLEFLRKCDNDDLLILTDYITKDKKGKTRLTERLTSTKEYKAFYPNNLTYLVDKIEKEFRLFGGNTLVNLVRGNGPSYREILIDVAKRTKTKFNKNATVADIEAKLIENILEKEFESMSEE